MTQNFGQVGSLDEIQYVDKTGFQRIHNTNITYWIVLANTHKNRNL